ncbi:thiol-disulfide oxidoreductase DCC family protein [Dongia sp. agr-C8]
MLKREDQDRAERRLERLIAKLPPRMMGFVHWLRDPQRFWLRVPLGILFVLAAFAWFLPVLGLWMAPLGIVLLAQDFAPLRRLVYRLINWTARRRPHWFGEQAA